MVADRGNWVERRVFSFLKSSSPSCSSIVPSGTFSTLSTGVAWRVECQFLIPRRFSAYLLTIQSPPLFAGHGSMLQSLPRCLGRVWSDMPATVGTSTLRLLSSHQTVWRQQAKAATRKGLDGLAARGEEIEPLSRPLECALEGHDEYLTASRKHPGEPLNWIYTTRTLEKQSKPSVSYVSMQTVWCLSISVSSRWSQLMMLDFLLHFGQHTPPSLPLCH